ncbi:TonB-dependent receptor [Adhaeribacter pallidiroseus]|uniref:TonB-dependent receptor plug domain-containing protein n=1 Tax=Adhaeribacter pallidiroseus TaxID=2072847 RepID=A0A369QAD2_9BACT|nr:TonB-dependent receptor [Adhaeribacter pallidiroseus]RDC61861.1 hypothetical protein AHMF7616_00450 [Adhaeribacter pallidiroseus]
MKQTLPGKINCYPININKSSYFCLTTLFILSGFFTLATSRPVILPEKFLVTKKVVLAGTIAGSLRDYETNEALIGATAVIEGTQIGASVNTDGTFTIKNVPEGLHTLVFSFIGYKSAKVPNVQVKGGTITRVDYKLVTDNSTLAEVVIRAKVVPENTTERLLIDEIRNSRSILSGISNEQITKSLDRDAGEVVRRVSGVTLVSDRFVIIRGLDPRYTLTLLNDLPAPSSESDRRAFSYDMLNSSVIDRVVIAKTPAPELQGDFSGGVVKVYTKSFANARQLQIQLSGQFRPGSSFMDYYTSQSGKYDRLGFDDGTRKLPANLPDIKNFPDVERQNNVDQAAVQAANAQIAKSFPNTWKLLRRYQDFDKRAVVNYYDSWHFGQQRLNSLTSLSYTLTNEFNRINRQYGEIRRYNDPNVRSYPLQSSLDSTYVQSARIGAMQNFRWNFNEQHSIEFKNLFNQLGRNQTLVREYRTDDDGTYEKELRRNIQYNFRSRGLYNGLLAGDHTWGKTNPTKLTWRLGYAHTTEQQPDVRRFNLARRENLPGVMDSSNAPQPPGYYRLFLADRLNLLNSRFYSTLHENGYTAAADAERTLGKNNLTVKAGFFSDYRKRNYDTKLYTYYLTNTNITGPLAEDLVTFKENSFRPDLNGQRMFAPRNFRADGSGFGFNDYTGLREAPGYTASNEQHAGYAALNIPLLGQLINVYGGIRLEYNKLDVSGNAFPFGLVRRGEEMVVDTVVLAAKEKLYALPSLNISYRFVPKMLVRAAYGKTLNRQEFREVSPTVYYDLDRLAYIRGNPFLENATIQNLDLRWEYYPQDDEIISVGAFYKHLKNPIEYVSQAISGFANDDITFLNTSKSTAYGLEVEFRKRLAFIPVPFMQYVSVIANASLLKTQVVFPDSLFTNSAGDPRRSIRPLQGSSPYAINAGIYYDNTNAGTQVTAQYNVIGQRLTTAGNSFTAEQYELARHVIDLTITQRITRFLQVKLGVQDLLNQPFRIYRDVVPDQKYKPNKLAEIPRSDQPTFTSDYLEATYKPGSYYSFGVQLTF